MFSLMGLESLGAAKTAAQRKAEADAKKQAAARKQLDAALVKAGLPKSDSTVPVTTATVAQARQSIATTKATTQAAKRQRRLSTGKTVSVTPQEDAVITSIEQQKTALQGQMSQLQQKLATLKQQNATLKARKTAPRKLSGLGLLCRGLFGLGDTALPDASLNFDATTLSIPKPVGYDTRVARGKLKAQDQLYQLSTDLQADLKAVVDSINLLQQQINSLLDQITTLTTENAALQAQADQSTADISTLDTNVQTLDTNIQQVETNVETVQQQAAAAVQQQSQPYGYDQYGQPISQTYAPPYYPQQYPQQYYQDPNQMVPATDESQGDYYGGGGLVQSPIDWGGNGGGQTPSQMFVTSNPAPYGSEIAAAQLPTQPPVATAPAAAQLPLPAEFDPSAMAQSDYGSGWNDGGEDWFGDGGGSDFLSGLAGKQRKGACPCGK